MSWNDGEVTVVPYQIKKPSYAGKYWKPLWLADYKGREFNISKPPKGHFQYGDGYKVNYKWNGQHPQNKQTGIMPQIIGLDKLKTMPQAKKLIRTFVDDMNDGKLVDMNTGEKLGFTTFDTCTTCGVYMAHKEENTNLHHRKNMATHKLLDEFDKTPHYQCKYHTKIDVIETKYEAGELPSFDFGRTNNATMFFADLKHKKSRQMKLNDIDEIVPDSELIIMLNPYLQMARRRRGLEAEEEEEGYWSPKELVLKDYAIRTNEGKTMSIHALWEFKGDEFSTFTNISGSVAGTQSLEAFKEYKQKHEGETANDAPHHINKIARPFASKIAMCEMIHNMMKASPLPLKITDYEFISYRSGIYKDEEILFAMKDSNNDTWLKYKYDNKTGVGRWSQSKKLHRFKKRDYDSGEFVWGIREGDDDVGFRKYGEGNNIKYEGGWRGYYREMKKIKVLNVKNDKFSKFLWTTNPEFFYNILIKLEPSMKDDFEWVNTKKNVRLQMARRRRGLEAEGIATNPLLWTGATVIALLSYFKSN